MKRKALAMAMALSLALSAAVLSITPEPTLKGVHYEQ
jgi:hypothetical protein